MFSDLLGCSVSLAIIDFIKATNKPETSEDSVSLATSELLANSEYPRISVLREMTLLGRLLTS